MAVRPILKGGGAVLAVVLIVILVQGPLAEHFLERGREARDRWSLGEASSALRWACRLSRAEPSCLELARILLWQGDIRSARAVLDRLAPRLDPGSAEEARFIDLYGVVDYGHEDFAAAIAKHRRAREMATEHGLDALAARATIHEARANYFFGSQYERARGLLEEALAIGRSLGNAELEADARRNLAVVRWLRGDGSGARADYFPVLELYRRLGHRRGEAITLSNISLIDFQEGNYSRFLPHQEASITIKEEIGDLAGLGESYSYLGSFYRYMGHLAKAHEALQRSLELHRRLGYRLGHREAEARLLRIKAQLGRYDEAISFAEALLASAPQEPAARLYAHQSLAGVFLDKGDTKSARRHAARVLEIEGLQEEPGWQAYPYLVMVLSRIKDGDPDAAEVWLDKLSGLSLAHRGNVFPGAVKNCRAKIARLRGRRSEALAHYLEAVDAESRMYDTADGDLVFGQHVKLYNEFLLLLLEKRLSPDEKLMAFDVLERLRYRSLRNREPGRRRAPASADAVRSSLDPGSALVFYIFSHTRAAALVVSRERFDAVELPADRRALEIKVKLYRAALTEARLESVLSSVAADLHGRLIAPLEAAGVLAGIDRLGIVPFGSLHDLPFAGLLRDGEPPRFLIEDYVLFYPPSATFLQKDHGSTDGPAVVFGYNGGDDGPALAFAEDEARAVAGLLGGRAWTGAAATEAEVLARATGARTLHVAAHAVSEPMMPLLSHLRLAPDENDDGRLTVDEVLDLRLDLDLVTLGACRTAQSHPPAGSLGEIDRLGLIEAFLYAGTASVVASLLPVDDRATRELMEHFYSNLAHMDKASALAEAQRAAQGGKDSRLSHPRVWAPFVLIGADR